MLSKLYVPNSYFPVAKVQLLSPPPFIHLFKQVTTLLKSIYLLAMTQMSLATAFLAWPSQQDNGQS